MDNATIEVLARRAGLDKALAEFPEDVTAAASRRTARWRDEGADRSARRALAADARRERAVSDLHWLTAAEATEPSPPAACRRSS